MQIDGLIPLRSATDQPIAPLCSLRMSMSCFSWFMVRLEAITTGSVWLEPRNAYLREAGRVLSSSCGGNSTEGGDG